MRLSLDLPVQRDWANVARVRAAVEALVLAATGDAELAAAAAMTAAELGENAVKYGDWSGGAGAFRVQFWADEAGLHVAVESPAPGREVPAALAATLAGIAGFASAEDAYRARVRALAGGEDGSRLGLVRLAYEAGCALRAEAEEGVVRVVADLWRSGCPVSPSS